jgi:hypothetical protein
LPCRLCGGKTETVEERGNETDAQPVILTSPSIRSPSFNPTGRKKDLKGQIESGVLYFVAPRKTCGKELVIEMGVNQQVNHVLDIPRGF